VTKIMLVEDDNSLREIYEARLAAEGYQIVSAQDGEEALAVAAKERPDLVISDVMMPKISGFEMLDILRNTDGLKNVKVIMLTALGQSEDKTRADALGADRYLVKSQVTLEDIVNAAGELVKDSDTPAVTPAPPVTATPAASAPTPAPQTPAADPVSTPPVATPVTPAPAEPPVAPASDTSAPATTSAPAAPAVPVAVTPAPEPTAATPASPAPAAEPTAEETPAPAAEPAAPEPAAVKPVAPVMPEPVSEVPTPVEVSPEPVEVTPAPEPAAPETATPPMPEPSSLAEEEAFMQAQIDQFVQKNPDTTASDTDKQLAAVAEVLSSSSSADSATPAPAAPAPVETPPTQAAEPTAEETPAPAAEPVAPEPAKEETNDAPTPAIAHRNKIIQPINGSAAKPDINALLAIEEAKEAAAAQNQGETPAASPDEDDKKPGIDPNSIAL